MFCVSFTCFVCVFVLLQRNNKRLCSIGLLGYTSYSAANQEVELDAMENDSALALHTSNIDVTAN